MSRLSFEVGTYRRKPPTDVGSEAEPDPMEEIMELAAKPLDVDTPDEVPDLPSWNLFPTYGGDWTWQNWPQTSPTSTTFVPTFTISPPSANS